MLSIALLFEVAAFLAPPVIMGVALPLLFLVIVALTGIGMYNRLVRDRLRTREAWSGVDVQLKRRSSLIPNLVEAVRGYAGHEREVFEQVTKARGALAVASGPAAAASADQGLSQALGRLLAVAENYPQLQAVRTFTQLQEELSDTEEKIAYARQFYNQNARAYNTRIQTFPSNQFANWFHFEPAAFFAAEESAAQEVKVSFSAA
jgi:LemA protein